VIPISQTLAQHFEQLCESGRLGHGYILHGPPKGFPAQAAMYLALSGLCAQKKPCMNCKICQKVLSHDHPDIRVLSADTTSVDAIRHVIQDIQLGARDGHRLFVCVLHADHMTPQAANAFLKTLEEPPAGVTLILATNALEQLLPTIRSRSTCIACPSVPAPQIRQWITHKTGTDYQGLVSQALVGYIEKTGIFPQEIVSRASIANHSVSEILSLAESLAKDKAIAKLAMQQWLEDCVRPSDNPETLQNNAHAARHLLTHIKNSHYNLNVRLQMESVLFGLQRQ
jgi:DNA polymerase III subunit delta'